MPPGAHAPLRPFPPPLTSLSLIFRKGTVRYLYSLEDTDCTTITSLYKVILEEGRVAALSHAYAVKSPLVTMARPKFAAKSTLSRGPIPKPHYLPHSWTRPTYDAKRHPDPIRCFSTMRWTDRQTDRPTDRSRESLTTIVGCCALRAMRPNNK